MADSDGGNAKEFNLALGDYAAQIDMEPELLLHAVMMRLLSGVVLGTRVDTGRARGNWQVGSGPPPPEGAYDENLFDQSGGPTIARGESAILDLDGRELSWIYNGVPYVPFLEEKDRMVEGNLEAITTWLDALVGAE